MAQQKKNGSKTQPVKKSETRGRKPKLQPDDQTLTTLSGLAKIQCTALEAAAVLGVSEPTFYAFLKTHEKARETWDLGREVGRASLRRLQWKAAERSTTMQIWLGKQWLGQTDKLEEKVTAEHEHKHTFVDDAASQLDAGLDQHIARARARASIAATSDGSASTH